MKFTRKKENNTKYFANLEKIGMKYNKKDNTWERKIKGVKIVVFQDKKRPTINLEIERLNTDRIELLKTINLARNMSLKIASTMNNYYESPRIA